MQFSAVVLAALATAVSAQLPTNVDPAQASALLVLATALPPSVLAAAATNQAGFASEVAGSIAAGQTPAWYQALPSDVKSALISLYPAAASAATASATAAPSSSYAESSAVESSSAPETTAETTAAPTAPAVVPSASAPGTGVAPGQNSTSVTGVNTPTLSGTGSPQPTDAPGAGSVPSVALGAGIAGAMAFLGMLAL